MVNRIFDTRQWEWIGFSHWFFYNRCKIWMYHQTCGLTNTVNTRDHYWELLNHVLKDTGFLFHENPFDGINSVSILLNRGIFYQLRVVGKSLNNVGYLVIKFMRSAWAETGKSDNVVEFSRFQSLTNEQSKIKHFSVLNHHSQVNSQMETHSQAAATFDTSERVT